MPSIRESITSRIRRTESAEEIEVRRRNKLADFRAKNSKALQQLADARRSRDDSADALDAVARDVAAMREMLKPIVRTK